MYLPSLFVSFLLVLDIQTVSSVPIPIDLCDKSVFLDSDMSHLEVASLCQTRCVLLLVPFYEFKLMCVLLSGA